MPKLRVLIVDDAVVVRKILSDTLSADPALEVYTAANGRIALAKLTQINPDLVTLDMEMPEMDGLSTLKALRKEHPRLPVIMFSTLTERGAAATLDALTAGANDYVTKPANVGSVSMAMQRIREELIPKIKALCLKVEPPPPAPRRPLPLASPQPAIAAPGAPLAIPSTSGHPGMLLIGSSTGGPNALCTVVPALPRTLSVPAVIVQHMPPVFTRLLAERLAAQSQIPVREGADGMIVRPGECVVAPGGVHTVVQCVNPDGSLRLATTSEPPENSCRPAVDVLFRTGAQAAARARTGVLAVVLTGMGSDGMRGCEFVRELGAGGQVVAQDEATSVVWGMPGFVARAGLADRVLPLDQIAQEIARRVERVPGAARLLPPTPPHPRALAG